MKTTFEGKKISAILGVLPQNEIYFEDEVGNYDFPEKQTLRLKKVMGYEKHRIAKNESTVSDFAAYGIKYMLENEWFSKEEIGAIVVVTLCPDHFVPHISNIIHGKFAFSEDVICLDIAQGCCGFLIGLLQSFMLLEHIKDKKILLINGDVLSRKISKRDRNDFPLVGDGTCISIIENDKSASKVYYEMRMDGSRGEALIIPAGGLRMPSSIETSEMQAIGDGNYRSLDNMHMDGTAVFNFVQSEVPGLINSILETASCTIDDIDYYLFHQPNKFMLQKLAQKIGIPYEKIPMNLVETYGNPSGASIPMVTLLNLGDKLLSDKYKCCLSAFGSGLAWGGAILEIGELDNCELIESVY